MVATAPKRDALDFYIGAKGFKEAAKYIHVSPHAVGNDGLIFLPIQTLIGFSLELYLKAWLVHSGLNEDEVKNKYGHRLEDLRADAESVGLAPITNLQATVEATAGSHKDYTYRYFNRHLSYHAMGLGTAFQVLDDLDEAVDTMIGASAAMGKAPGH